MHKIIVKSVLFVALAGSLLSFDLPKGWFRKGSLPDSYEMGIDKGAGIDGKNAATIKSKEKYIYGFGTLMQQCLATQYFGKRIKLSGSIKSENVAKWAGLWLRVDHARSKEALSFDNMEDRAVKGTTNWTRYEIVLDVPDDASILAYGVLLDGTGQVWFDNMTIEIVNNDVKTTGYRYYPEPKTQNEPTNLSFEE